MVDQETFRDTQFELNNGTTVCDLGVQVSAVRMLQSIVYMHMVLAYLLSVNCSRDPSLPFEHHNQTPTNCYCYTCQNIV